MKWIYITLKDDVASLPAGSPPNGVELIPPRPREGAVVVVDMTLVESPVKGALDTEPNPNPKIFVQILKRKH